MSTGVALPAPSEIRRSAEATALLVTQRWRMVRGVGPKVAVWVGPLVLMALLFAVSHIGYGVRRFAEQGSSTAAGQFAVNYVVALERGELGAIGAAALGSAVAASLISPLTGSANQSLAAAEDLVGLRPPRLHRWFDSLVTAGVSTIGLLQLLTLTGVASLLTLDGGRVAGLLLTWALWPVLVLAAVAEGWAIDWLDRRAGRRARLVLSAAVAGGVALALLVAPENARTLFGLGTAYADTLRAAAAGDSARVAAAAGVLAVAALLMAAAGLLACRGALALPATVRATSARRRRLVPMSTRPRIALAQVLFAHVLRTSEIRRPLLTILVIGIPAVWIGGAADSTAVTLVVAAPLAVALAWGVNTFGVLGPGMTWLASQPGAMRSLLWTVTAVQVALSAMVVAACWVPPLLGGRLDLADAVAVAAASTVSASLTARSAASKAVLRPSLARIGQRGDLLVPPLTAINYTARFALWAGQAGVLTFSLADTWLQVSLAAVAVCWSALRMVRLHRRWNDRVHQARLVATVAAA